MTTGTAELPAAPIKPDQVYAPGEAPKIAEWDEACPYCGSHWATGPERDQWGRWHCWSCGFNPDLPTASPSSAPVVSAGQIENIVAQAVQQALSSQAQSFATMMTDLLGPAGMADLAAARQKDLGFSGEGKSSAELQAELAENDQLRQGGPIEPAAGPGGPTAPSGSGADAGGDAGTGTGSGS